MDSLKQYEKELEGILHSLEKYLALQYLAWHGKVVDIVLKYEFSHHCGNFKAQVDGSACGSYMFVH